MRYGIRASAETAATIARCLFTAVSVVWASKNGRAVGVLPFALGQMAYAILLFSVYLVQLWPIASKDRFSLLPKRIASNDRTQYIFSYFSRPLCSLGASLFLQSSIKYVLTQGDSLLITSLASLHDQGAYALAANYGGLVARMLFQPIEESSRTLFAKLCASPLPSEVSHSSSSSSADDTKKAATAAPDRQPITRPTTTPPSADSDSLRQASSILLDILKFYFLLGTVAVTAGPSLASPLLTLVAGSRWTSTGAGAVLASYSFYIPLLALNGVSEAFVAAVASTQQLHGQSAVMGAFFGAFAGVAYLCVGVLGWGARGLVAANCVNLGLRSAWNVVFVTRYFARKQVAFELSGALPTPWTVAAATMVPATMHFTDGLLARYGVFGELVQKGGVAALFVLVL
ncbi:Oligosaccharide translocation protein rft1 [Cryomyces antarcticus]|uniref:Man(5)GlcNAc(2)-PP-dolichol translocation protein RFT1 n=1 Tax=Cryomyces antarcticus TaxID=329879 RepID=A0ABR0LN38_9PEZI|nr:Oligosaccharide translocation protein rft1 [Cryomyces antarcticus]